MTADSTSSACFQVINSAGAPLGTNAFEVLKADNSTYFVIPIVGGASTVGADWRAYNSAGTAYAAMKGSMTPCIELPDGPSAQGSRIYGGSGAPDDPNTGIISLGSSTVQPRAGDYYIRRWGGQPDLVAMTKKTGATSGNSSVGTQATPNGVVVTSGAPLVGDLVVVCIASTNTAATTVDIGATTGQQCVSAYGGFSFANGTRFNNYYSHVVQSGDITTSGADTYVNVALPTISGSGPLVSIMLFRHPNGFDSSKTGFGCPVFASTNGDTGVTTGTTMTITGPHCPHVVVTSSFRSSAAGTPTVQWDSIAGNTTPDATNGDNFVACKPGSGSSVNSGSVDGYLADGSTVTYTLPSSTYATSMVSWAAQTTIGSTWYVCTAAGSPGTWSALF